MKIKQNRMAGFAIITIAYIIAAVIGVAVFRALPEWHIFLRVLIGDVAATVFIYLIGVLIKNASVYDPYWSVAPIFIISGLVIMIGVMNFGIALLLIAIWYWGVRLTANWAYTFKNLDSQDWRYDMFKAKYPKIFQLVSFFGIHMFPTMVVYLCLLPGIVFVQDSKINAVTLIGFVICILAASLQLIADIQLHRFRRNNSGNREIIREGLWKHSRHPNYLGEIMMWWGVYIFMLSASPHMWILGIGPLVNTLMFVFVSIPMADRHNRSKREGFDEYVKETNSLFLFV